MPLLNYTTKVPVKRTVDEIQGLLIKAGARSIMANYDDEGRPTGIAFQIETPLGRSAFSLPAHPEKVYDVMLRDDTPRSYCDPAQAERIAWRILKDWVEAQLAIVRTEMVTLEQVMLPYMHGDDGRTVYELFMGRQLALPSGDDDVVVAELVD